VDALIFGVVDDLIVEIVDALIVGAVDALIVDVVDDLIVGAVDDLIVDVVDALTVEALVVFIELKDVVSSIVEVSKSSVVCTGMVVEIQAVVVLTLSKIINEFNFYKGFYLRNKCKLQKISIFFDGVIPLSMKIP